MNNFHTLILFLTFIWIICGVMDWRLKNLLTDSYLILAGVLSMFAGIGYLLLHSVK